MLKHYDEKWCHRKIAHYRKRDKQHGYKSVNYSAQWLLKQFKINGCIYCGEKDIKKLTLDKKWNDTGHWKLNCVISCIDCNVNRGDIDPKEWQKMKQDAKQPR